VTSTTPTAPPPRLAGIGAGATRNEGEEEEGAKIFVSTNISLRKFQIIRMKLE
jgi:hypothetical protein